LAPAIDAPLINFTATLEQQTFLRQWGAKTICAFIFWDD
jgi:hypothetical protein